MELYCGQEAAKWFKVLILSFSAIPKLQLVLLRATSEELHHCAWGWLVFASMKDQQTWSNNFTIHVRFFCCKLHSFILGSGLSPDSGVAVSFVRFFFQGLALVPLSRISSGSELRLRHYPELEPTNCQFSPLRNSLIEY